jgi:hypothetical protein
LGRGYALQAHGLLDRPSNDLDTYTATMDATVFDAAASAVARALRQAGYAVTTVAADSWFRALREIAETTGRAVAIDLGYDYRGHRPIPVAGAGPVLDLNDVVVGKVRACWDRRAAGSAAARHSRPMPPSMPASHASTAASRERERGPKTRMAALLGWSATATASTPRAPGRPPRLFNNRPATANGLLPSPPP